MEKQISMKDLDKIKARVKKERGNAKYILHVCFGGGCVSSNCKAVKEALEEALDKHNYSEQVIISETGCIGACNLGPSLLVEPGNTYYIKLSPEDMEKIVINHIGKGEVVEERCYFDEKKNQHIPKMNDIDFFAKQKKIILNNCGLLDFGSIDDYIYRDGYKALAKSLLELSADKVVDEIKDSGLRGRGGAGFPTGLKWEYTAKEKNAQKYIICNADEGDPGAFMDRSLLEGDPHKIIEGMAIGGYAIGASKGYVYVRAEYPLAIERLRKAITDAKNYGILGEKLFGSSFSFDIEIRIGAGAFVCGEETSLIHSIEGQRGEPRQKPPYPAQSGLFDVPTVINNVETLANIAPIILNSADWFKQYGTEKSRGTKIFALAGAIKNTGLVEVPMGITLGDVIYDIGGGIKNNKKFKAAQTGGPSGGCLTKKDLNTPIDYDSLKALGSIMGSGGLICMDEDNCMVDIAHYFMEFIQEESCGKCVPCRVGTKRMLEILERIVEGKGEKGDIDKLIELAETIKETALCGLGQSAPNPVLSTIKHFRDEYEAHIKDKKCPAGTCGDLFISPCQNACPAGINVPGYIALIADNRVEDAYELIRKDNPLPAVCGRVCTHPCESKCRRSTVDEAVAICDLKRYAADKVRKNGYEPDCSRLAYKNKSIGIIGAGPSGLACGYFLAKLGYEVKIYEKEAIAGGVLAFGIPEYRLPEDILQHEIETIKKAGVKIQLNTEIGVNVDLKLLRQKHDAIYVSTGTQFSNKIGVEGETLEGVLYGLDFLKDVNLGRDVKIGQKVGVIGGGSTAMDAARVAKRLGAEEVHILYRRTRDDMPADKREIDEALEEGILLHTMVKPVEITGENHVEGIKLCELVSGPFDQSGRRRPVEKENSEYTMAFDTIIPAVSQHSDLPFISEDEVELTKWGTFVINKDNMMTKSEGIFAGGDVVRGPDTAIQAIADGKKTAKSIDLYLGGKGELYTGKEIEIPKPEADPDIVEHERFEMKHLSPESRVTNFDEVTCGYHKLNALAESMRCLRCDKRI